MNTSIRRLLRPAVAALALVMGQALVRADLPTTAAVATEKRLFWKVTTPTTEAYFLGSVHVASPKMYPLPAEIEAAFGASKVLVVELDIATIDQSELAVQMIEQGVYPVGDNLEKHLSPETFASLRAYCEKNHIPLTSISQFKPAIAMVTLETLALARMGMSSELGIDKHFLTKAHRKDGPRIVSLETAKAQLDLLFSLDDGLAEPGIKQVIDPETPATMAAMFEAWKHGDVKAMEGIVSKESDTPDGSKATDRLINDRNVTMAASLKPLLAGKEKIFVIVGAAHLVGEKGLIRMMEKEKFKVEQPDVTPPPAPPATTKKS